MSQCAQVAPDETENATSPGRHPEGVGSLTADRHTFREMLREYLRDGSLRELVLDGATISALLAGAVFAPILIGFPGPTMAALDRALPILAPLPLACLLALVAMSRFDDQDFILFLKTSRTYNTLEFQFAYYERVAVLAIIAGAAYYLVRSLGEATVAPLTVALVWATALTWSIAGTYLSFQTRRKYQALYAEFIEALGPKR